MEFSKILRAEYMKSCWWKMAYTPGIKTAYQPVLLDVPDSLDAEEGVGGVGLVTGTSGRSAVLFPLSGSQAYKAFITYSGTIAACQIAKEGVLGVFMVLFSR